jgi:AraC-like DNA-binding protein
MEADIERHDLIQRIISYADAREAEDHPLMTGIPGFSITRSRAPTMMTPIFYHPIFCLVLQGAKQAYLGERPVTFGEMESVIVSFDLPTVARVVKASRTEPYVALALKLDVAMLRELSAEMGDSASASERGDAIAVGEAGDAVVEATGRLFGLLEKPDAARVLTPLLMREIHYWMLSAEHGAMLRSLARADTHAARIARATVMIQQNYAEPLRVADLARAAGMSPSAFHEHFKAITGTTPVQYQKLLRLMEARRLILTGEHSISSAAFTVGYESPNQFSREYSRQFGAPPRNDAAAHL